MASTPAIQTASELASQHHAAQAALAGALAQQVLAAWNALLDVAQLKKTIPALSAGIAALVHQYGGASAAVAADYYDTARAAAAVSGSYTVIPATPADLDEVTKNVRWATKGLWSAEPDVPASQVLTQGAVTTLALDTGRNTVVNAVQGDRQARGWARVTRPGCCYWCAMLASRGAVYKSRESATLTADGLPFHDHDRCQAEPVFGVYEMTAHARDFQALWKSSTKGTSGKAAIRAFRQAYEGRESSPARDENTPHGG